MLLCCPHSPPPPSPRAQFRQNRTILNSANPRLMNASFLKGSLIKSPVEQLRGSHSSRGSRAPSLASLQNPPDNGTGPVQPTATPTDPSVRPGVLSTAHVPDPA